MTKDSFTRATEMIIKLQDENAQLKYDGAEKTIDLLEVWLEEFKKK